MVSIKGPLVDLVERTVDGLGYELVDLEREGRGLLRVTIDRKGNTSASGAPPLVTLDDCETVSHQLTHLFAVEDVDYDRLEVSSPGVDRPLKRAHEYQRFTGAEVQLQLLAPLNGRKRWRGTIAGVSGAAGAERIRLSPTPDEDAKEPVRRVGAVKKVNKKAGQKSGAPTEPPADVEFALADVDKARLVPVLDFRSKR
jgi:ribosome maturation factor RimP